MKIIVELIQIDFDSSENHNPRYSNSLGMFEEGGSLTANGNAAEWLSKQPPIKMYWGYDGNIYPKIISKSTYLTGS